MEKEERIKQLQTMSVSSSSSANYAFGDKKQEGKSFYVSPDSSGLTNFTIVFDEHEGIDFLNQYASINLDLANQAIREINYVKPTEEDYDELPF